MKFIVVGDSVSMPRPEIGLTFEDTYAGILDGKGMKSYLYACYGSDRVKTRKEHFCKILPYLKNERYDFAILHIGIVDCAPRVIPLWMRTLLGGFPALIKKHAVSLLHNNRSTIMKIHSFRYASPEEYANYISWFVASLLSISKTVIIIGIAPIPPSLEEHSPGLSKSIKEYNDILRITSFLYGTMIIDPPEGAEHLTLDAHITKTGHQFIADRIESIVK